MSFKKGNTPWNKGVHYSQEMHNKIFNDEWRDKHSKSLTGRKITWSDKMSKTRKKLIKEGKIKVKSGDAHYNWKGGKNKWQRKQNRKHLKEIGIIVCELCGVDEGTHGKKLDVHHKDSDHQNNTIDNLMLLCTSCHSKGHFKTREICDECGRLKGKNHKCPTKVWYNKMASVAIFKRERCVVCGKLFGKDKSKHSCKHPKGMLGKHHTEETKEKIKAAVKK